jgi:hypothetical protein
VGLFEKIGIFLFGKLLKIKFEVEWVLYSASAPRSYKLLAKEDYTYGETPFFKGTINEFEIIDEKSIREFKGWSEVLAPIKSNKVFYSVFEKKDRFYSIKWNYKDKLEHKEYRFGEVPICNLSIPLLNIIDKEFEETFVGWDKEITKVTCDQVYKALIKVSKRIYVIKFVINEEIFERRCIYGELPKPPHFKGQRSLNSRIVFLNWDSKIVPVDEEKTYRALTKKIELTEFLVMFIGLNDELIESTIVKKNSKITVLPDIPSYNLSNNDQSHLYVDNQLISIPRTKSKWWTFSPLAWNYFGAEITQDSIIHLSPNPLLQRPIIYLNKKKEIIFKSFPILYYFLPLPPKEYLDCDWKIVFKNDCIFFYEKENDYEERTWFRINKGQNTRKVLNVFKTELKGVTFNNRQDTINYLIHDEELTYKREVENPFDKNAILITTLNGAELGYLPKEIAENLYDKLEAGISLEIKVSYLYRLKDKNYRLTVEVKEVESENRRCALDDYLNAQQKFQKNQNIDELYPYLFSVVLNQPTTKAFGTIQDLLYYLTAKSLEKLNVTDSSYHGHYKKSFYYEGEINDLYQRSKINSKGNLNNNEIKTINPQEQIYDLKYKLHSVNSYVVDESGIQPLMTKTSDTTKLKAVKFLVSRRIKKKDKELIETELISYNNEILGDFIDNKLGSIFLLGFEYSIEFSHTSNHENENWDDTGLGFSVLSSTSVYYEKHFDITIKFPFQFKYLSEGPFLYKQTPLILKTVKFNSDGGDLIEDLIYFRFNFESELPRPSKSYYSFQKFEGWYFGEKKITYQSQLETLNSENITLKAKWSEIKRSYDY